jgi:prepilin-type N-terminal cleavage/methylation domain-containing protein
VPRPGKQSGFTLLEVVLALSILGAAAMILIETHYNSVHLHTVVKDEVTMRSLLQQAAGTAELEVASGNLSDSDDFSKRYPDFQYSFQASPVGEEYLGLYEVQVTVEGPNEERSLSLYVFLAGEEGVTGTQTTEGGSEE